MNERLSEYKSNDLIGLDELVEYAKLEDLIFKCDPANLETIGNVIKKYDESIIRQLIFYCAEVRRSEFPFLLKIWKMLPPTSKKYPKNAFVKYLCQKGQLPYTSNTYKNYERIVERNSLEEIIYNHDFDKFVSYYDSCTNIEEKTFTFGYEIYNVFQFAAFCRSVNIFKYLVLEGWKIDESVAESAVCGGDLQIISICMENGINMIKFLPQAIEYHHNDIVEWMINNFPITQSINYLSPAAESFNTTAFIYFFGEYFDAAKKSNSQEILMIWAKGLNVNLRTLFNENHPLIVAASAGNFEVVKFLIKNGANPYLEDSRGTTIATYANIYDCNMMKEYLKSSIDKKPTIVNIRIQDDLD